MSSAMGYKSARMVGGRVLKYNASTPVVASSRWNQLQRAFNKEKGYLDISSASYALDLTGSVTLLNPVPQGAATTQRVGKTVQILSLQHRGLVTSNSATTVVDVAFMIVYDKRPTGTLPAITDILKSATSLSLNNDDNAQRFSILKRWDAVCIGNGTTPTTGMEAYSTDFWLKINRPTIYKAAGTGAIGDIEEGALYLVTIGNQAGAAGASLVGTFRTRFLDN